MKHNYQYYYLLILSLVLFKSLFSLIVRVRLPNGLTQRIDINNNSTIVDFNEILIKQINLSNNTIYKINQTVYNTSDSLNTNHLVKLSELGIKHGDIINIESTIINKSSDSNVNTYNISNKSKSKIKYKRDSKPDDKRNDLIKIIREKRQKKTLVLLSFNTGRIIKRLSSGGIGLAIGKTIANYTTTSPKKKLSKKTLNIDEDKPRDLIEIYSIFELSNCIEESKLSWVIDNKLISNINQIKSIAESLGLDIVGYCVGLPIQSKTLLWSSYHIITFLQIQQILNNKNLFILSIAKAIDDDKRQIKLINKKKLMNKSFGFTIEAFTITNQTFSLIDQDILPTNPIENDNIVEITSNLNSLQENKIIGKLSKISLLKPVIVQYTESKLIDALLLASPIPIASLEKSIYPFISFEHSFPTSSELLIADMSKIAKRQIIKILGSVGSDETKRRLCDIHLLHYIKSNNLLDEQTFAVLCQSLTDVSNSGKRLPSYIISALDMIKMALTSTNTNEL